MTALLAGLAFLIAAAVSVVLIAGERSRDRAFRALVIAGSALGAVPAVRALAGGDSIETRWQPGLPGGDWVIGVDALSAVFLLAVLGVGAACAVYGVAYMRAGGNPGRARFSHAAFAVLMASLAVVVTARSVMLFLVAWELMAIGSFVLIMSDHERAEVRRAGLIYLVTTHAATLLLFVAFALWARGAPDWTFASLAATGPGDAASRGGLLVLVLVAFGVKAGIVPLHFWLPGAHAAAPSHVSAAMSGLVIKTGIYGLFRVLALTGSPPAWWGWTVLTLGVASAVLGVLWALAQHDIKRLLAYHSVENIGIILMGMGVGALGSANGNAALATLGYGAALLHTVNHALFKALLFLSAGAVYRATGTRNIEDLGGLGRLMPLTWGAFLVGAAAIIGVPPLNGFVSEWLVFQGLLATGRGAGGLGLALLGVPALALVGGLALACFAKAAGVMFLGNARSDRARGAREMPADFTAPALALAAACIAIGVLAGVVVPPLMGVGASLAGGPALLTDPLVAGTVGGAQRVSVFAFVLLATGGALALLRRALVGREPVRTEGTWACGYTATSPRMQYTASSFAAPLIAVFGRLSGVTEQRGATLFHSTPRDLVLDGVALPAWTRVQRAALRLRPMQQGRLHIYVLYVVATLVALLAWLVVTPGAAP